MGKTKARTGKPRLDVNLEEASVAEVIERVSTYLEERYGGLEESEVQRRIRGMRKNLHEINEDLLTADEGLSDALQRDERELADDEDFDKPVAAKHYMQERERLSRLIPQRWRLEKNIAELDLFWRMRKGTEFQEKARQLYDELSPLEKQMRELEGKVRRLQDERTNALAHARELTGPMKNLSWRVVELQQPQLGGLAKYIGIE